MTTEFIKPELRPEPVKIKNLINSKFDEIEELEKNLHSLNNISTLQGQLNELQVSLELGELDETDFKKSTADIKKEISLIENSKAELNQLISSKKTAINILNDRYNTAINQAEIEYQNEILKAVEKLKVKIQKEITSIEPTLKEFIELQLLYMSATGTRGNWISSFYADLLPNAVDTISLLKNESIRWEDFEIIERKKFLPKEEN